MTTFRKRAAVGLQTKNLEKAEQAFLEKADEPVERPDVVPPVEAAPAPQKARKYGYASFNLRLTDDELERLRRAALKHDRSMHWYAHKMLMQAIDEDLST